MLTMSSIFKCYGVHNCSLLALIFSALSYHGFFESFYLISFPPHKWFCLWAGNSQHAFYNYGWLNMEVSHGK